MINKIQKPLTMKRWVLFTTYGWFLGILLVVAFALIAETLVKMNDESGGQAAVGIGMGSGVGLMQWLATRRYLAKSQKHFWFTTLGFSVAFILRDLIAPILSEKSSLPITVEVTIPFAVLLGALISGWFQYYFLFRTMMDNAFKWIYYTMTGWLLATLITMSTAILNFKTGENVPKALIVLLALTFLSVGGPILGYITGKFIVTRINDLDKNNSPNV